MKLKKIIEYLDVLSFVIVWQMDAYIGKEVAEKVFEGCVMDIPWIYLNYYLVENKEGKAIESRLVEENGTSKSYLFITIVQDKENV